MPGTPMGDDGVEHGAKNNDTDNHAYSQTKVMQVLDAPAHVGNAFA
jgi:hypothetical protein